MAPIPRALSIIVASRHLPLYPWGEAWCREVVGGHLSRWVHDGSDVLVMSPEGQPWVLELAERTGSAWQELRRDGVLRQSLAPDGRWAPEGEVQHPHRVADRLVLLARAARARGWEVEIVTLRLAGRRDADGCDRLVTQSLRQGLDVTGYTHLGLEAV